jgi:hypothetical protein
VCVCVCLSVSHRKVCFEEHVEHIKDFGPLTALSVFASVSEYVCVSVCLRVSVCLCVSSVCVCVCVCLSVSVSHRKVRFEEHVEHIKDFGPLTAQSVFASGL